MPLLSVCVQLIWLLCSQTHICISLLEDKRFCGAQFGKLTLRKIYSGMPQGSTSGPISISIFISNWEEDTRLSANPNWPGCSDPDRMENTLGDSVRIKMSDRAKEMVPSNNMWYYKDECETLTPGLKNTSRWLPRTKETHRRDTEAFVISWDNRSMLLLFSHPVNCPTLAAHGLQPFPVMDSNWLPCPSFMGFLQQSTGVVLYSLLSNC